VLWDRIARFLRPTGFAVGQVSLLHRPARCRYGKLNWCR